MKKERLNPRRHRRNLAVIGVLLLAALVLAIANMMQGSGLRLIQKTTTISGVVVSEQNEPLQAEVFVLGTDRETQTNLQGAFTLEDVPAGDQILVIGYRFKGQEFAVSVPDSTGIDLGQFVIDTSNSLDEPLAP